MILIFVNLQAKYLYKKLWATYNPEGWKKQIERLGHHSQQTALTKLWDESQIGSTMPPPKFAFTLVTVKIVGVRLNLEFWKKFPVDRQRSVLRPTSSVFHSLFSNSLTMRTSGTLACNEFYKTSSIGRVGHWLIFLLWQTHTWKDQMEVIGTQHTGATVWIPIPCTVQAKKTYH